MSDQSEIRLDGIAIIGIACRFPGAKNVNDFWQNLCGGVESISSFTKEELIASGIDPDLVKNPNYVRSSGILGNTDLFDAAFFGISPREATLMDPQHRIFLECAWNAYEDSGHYSDGSRTKVGVFAGQSMNTYLLANIYPNLKHVASMESLEASIGNDKDSLTTQVAYRLNFTGPAVTIQSSSSTSLVAIHYACQSLLSFECDMALAGGVSIHFPEKAGYLYQEGGTTSPDGHCRTFDSKARGFVPGSGVGVVVLKRLSDALRDGDSIHAVIRGSAINNDGSNKVSYMAPGIEGQIEVIAFAQELAGIHSERIGYIETHGTGTLIGDPIEIAALTQAFRLKTDKKHFCSVGSVKPNIGHLDAAAGVAGLIKTVLMLKHKVIPPLINFETPNPNINFTDSPFVVNTKLTKWLNGQFPRIAGVSSFGMGGTNAHVILEEAPSIETVKSPRPAHLFLLSAKTQSALDLMAQNFINHLYEHPELDLPDIEHTLQVGRTRFDYRGMFVCSSREDALNALTSDKERRFVRNSSEAQAQSIIFCFTGQGSQRINMGRELYRIVPRFRNLIDKCCDLLKPSLGFDLKQIIFPSSDTLHNASEQLMQTAIAQPAIFTIEYALATLFISWGIKPVAMLGHSIGEYVAACLAGIFTLQDALELVAVRGQLMQQTAHGSMLAIPLSEQDVTAFLNAELSLAAVNSPKMCVVAGNTKAVENLQNRLQQMGIYTKILRTSHAFHSSLMEPILDTYLEKVKLLALNSPQIPFVSNVSGTWIKPHEATDPAYWVDHLRHTVRFSPGVELLLQDKNAVFLELGPDSSLSTLIRQHIKRGSSHTSLSAMEQNQVVQSEYSATLNALGHLWLMGVELNWAVVHENEQSTRISLPTYPYQPQRYWVDHQESKVNALKTQTNIHKQNIQDWFYLPTWQQSILRRELKRPSLALQSKTWLVFENEQSTGGLGDRFGLELTSAQQSVVMVHSGEEFRKHSRWQYTINPDRKSDYETLLHELAFESLLPEKIVHFWNVTVHDPKPTNGSELNEESLGQAFFSLLFLVQAYTNLDDAKALSIFVITNNIHNVGEGKIISPLKATIMGPCRVIPQEYSYISSRNIDIPIVPSNSWQETKLIDFLIDECNSKEIDSTVVYRDGQRWTEKFEAIRATGPQNNELALREEGVYLIIGGLGQIGYSIAEVLARRLHGRLVLVGRSTLPHRDQWNSLLKEPGENEFISSIRKIISLEEAGAEVLVLSADATNLSEMQTVMKRLLEHYGQINGVFYAAGSANESTYQGIKDITREDANNIFRIKIQGVLVLEEILGSYRLDICMMVSSLSSILGGLGLMAYSAGNNFIDVFTHKHNQSHATPWISVNWDAWRASASEHAPLALSNSMIDLSIAENDVEEILATICSMTVSGQIILSTWDLNNRTRQWGGNQAQQVENPSMGLHNLQQAPRPKLLNSYVAPRNETERRIAEVWQNHLGIEQIGINDNFFELGGNSLIGVQIISQLVKIFKLQISAVSLYEGPTISSLAEIITNLHSNYTDNISRYEKSRNRGERRRTKITGKNRTKPNKI